MPNQAMARLRQDPNNFVFDAKLKKRLIADRTVMQRNCPCSEVIQQSERDLSGVGGEVWWVAPLSRSCHDPLLLLPPLLQICSV